MNKAMRNGGGRGGGVARPVLNRYTRYVNTADVEFPCSSGPARLLLTLNGDLYAINHSSFQKVNYANQCSYSSPRRHRVPPVLVPPLSLPTPTPTLAGIPFFTYQTDEIHVDILNAHLQFVTPFLKQHGVEYERDRFTEKLDAGETSLDMTHLWLHRAIRQLRTAAGVAPSGAAGATTTVGGGGAVASPPPPPPTAAAAAEVEFYRQLLSDLDQRRGDAYLKLLRVAIVDNLLGAIVCVERKSGTPPTAPSPPSPPPPTVGASAMAAAAAAGAGSGKAAGAGARAGGVGGAAGAAVAAAAAAAERDDQQEDMLEGVAVPETLMLDRYRLVVIAAAAEQAAYTASLVAFARQALATMRMGLLRADEDRVRDALMVLFETEDVTSADICAQVWL